MAKRVIGWRREFDDPIELPDGRMLVTLRDAASYVQNMPKAQHDSPHWQVTVEHLIYAAERGPAWTLFAWMFMRRALSHGKPERPARPDKKAVKAYRIIR